jgi:hypothetical protein
MHLASIDALFGEKVYHPSLSPAVSCSKALEAAALAFG